MVIQKSPELKTDVKTDIKTETAGTKELKKRKNILYTGVGDSGITSLYDGNKVAKSDPIVAGLGQIEKLQKQIGLLHAWMSNLRGLSTKHKTAKPFSVRIAMIVLVASTLMGAIILCNSGQPRSTITEIFTAGLIASIVCSLVVIAEYWHKSSRKESLVPTDPFLTCELRDRLPWIAHDLYKMMCDVGVPGEKVLNLDPLYITMQFDRSAAIEEFESYIERMDKYIPAVTHFVMPIGGIIACNSGVTNAICRETELQIYNLLVNVEHRPMIAVTPITSYLNRLSSFLYALELYMRGIEGKELVFTTDFE